MDTYVISDKDNLLGKKEEPQVAEMFFVNKHFPIEIEVIADTIGFGLIKEEWNDLVSRSNNHIFQTHEWQYTWWNYFGDNRHLNIILFRKNSELVGIMPLFVDHFKILDKNICNVLRFIGSSVMQPSEAEFDVPLAFSDYLDIIVDPDYVNEVITTLNLYFDKVQGYYDEIILDEVPEKSYLLTSLTSILDTENWDYAVKTASNCPGIFLPGSWEGFVSSFSKHARSQIRRFVKRASNSELFNISTAHTDEEVKHAFDLLVKLHQQRWQNQGQPGIFKCPRMLGFLREVTLLLNKKGWVLLNVVDEDGNEVAADLSYVYKNSIYMMQRGFDDEAPSNKYGPGTVLLYKTIKNAIESGYNYFDFLRGEEDYKLRSSNNIRHNKEIIIRSTTAGFKKRTILAGIVKNIINLKRKLIVESEIMMIQFERHHAVKALFKYIELIFNRLKRKIKASQ